MSTVTGGAGPRNSKWRRFARLATADGLPRSSLKVALLVGTVLNLINQGDALLAHAAINWPKLVLTFLVPYGVSTYGAVAARLRQERERIPVFKNET